MKKRPKPFMSIGSGVIRSRTTRSIDFPQYFSGLLCCLCVRIIPTFGAKSTPHFKLKNEWMESEKLIARGKFGNIGGKYFWVEKLKHLRGCTCYSELFRLKI